MKTKKKIKVIFIPGNQGGTPQDNWFPYLKKELEKIGIRVIAKDFPDNVLAREKYWLPHIAKLGADENTILIGHSSGAVAAMRFVENNKILGSILVGASYTDLGDEMEKKSGYYDRPWNWKSIKKNQQWIVQFVSVDDPYIPIDHAKRVHHYLSTEYYEFQNEGHFGSEEKHKYVFPEIVDVIKQKLK